MSKQEKRKKTPDESLQLFIISSLDLTVAPPQVKVREPKSFCISQKRQPVTWSGKEVTDHWV